MQRKMMMTSVYGVATLVAAVVMMATLVDAQRFGTAGAMTNTMGVSLNAFDVSESSRILVRDFARSLLFLFPCTPVFARSWWYAYVRRENGVRSRSLRRPTCCRCETTTCISRSVFVLCCIIPLAPCACSSLHWSAVYVAHEYIYIYIYSDVKLVYMCVRAFPSTRFYFSYACFV